MNDFESPFLQEAPFAETREPEWMSRMGELEAESPFLGTLQFQTDQETALDAEPMQYVGDEPGPVSLSEDDKPVSAGWSPEPHAEDILALVAEDEQPDGMIAERESLDETYTVPEEIETGFERDGGEQLEDMEGAGDEEEQQIVDREAPVVFQHDTSSGSTREVVVGQRVELDLAKTAFASQVDKVKWTIPGRAVLGYEANADTARVIELTDADLQKPKLSFFWVDAEDGRTVRASIRTRAGGDEEFHVVFNVKGPKMKSLKATPGEDHLRYAHSMQVMQLGTPGDVAGMQWEWEIVMPTGYAGFTKDVQTVLGKRSRILRVKPGSTETRTLVWEHPSRNDPHVQLDGTWDQKPVKEPGYTLGLADARIEAGTSFTAHTSDSPSTGLPPLGKTVSVDDRFTYTVMFKPATDRPQDAIWVPVARVIWFWKSVATQRGGKWQLKSTKPKASVDMTTTEFPVYESYGGENEFRQVSPKEDHELPLAQEEPLAEGYEPEEEMPHTADTAETPDTLKALTALFEWNAHEAFPGTEHGLFEQQVGGGTLAMSPFPAGFAGLTAAPSRREKLSRAFSGAVDAVAATSPAVRNIPMAVVALDADGSRPLVGQHEYEMHYSGSLLKIAALYAAYQLRGAVNELAATLDPAVVDTEDKLFKAFENTFDPQIRKAVGRINRRRPPIPDKLRVPKFKDIFLATRTGGRYTLDFRAGPTAFFGHLDKMIVESNNDSAGVCIRTLGYSWINGVLQEAGFFVEAARGREGIWLAGDYGASPTVEVDSINDGRVKQATTCYDMAWLMAMLHDQRLVKDAVGNAEMLSLLKLAVNSRPPDEPHARSLLKRPFEPPPLGSAPAGTVLPFKILHTKIGAGQLKRDPKPPHLAGSCISGHIHGCVYSEASILQHSSGRKFVFVWQNVVDATTHALFQITRVIQKTMDDYHP